MGESFINRLDMFDPYKELSYKIIKLNENGQFTDNNLFELKELKFDSTLVIIDILNKLKNKGLKNMDFLMKMLSLRHNPNIILFFYFKKKNDIEMNNEDRYQYSQIIYYN